MLNFNENFNAEHDNHNERIISTGITVITFIYYNIYLFHRNAILLTLNEGNIISFKIFVFFYRVFKKGGIKL